MTFKEEDEGGKADHVITAIGNIGRWQWMIILPLAIREIFTSWQMLSPPFLAMKPTGEYYCDENGTDRFESLRQWSQFANPMLEDGSLDRCQVYDLSYQDLDFQEIAASNGSELTIITRPCTSWTFLDNETLTLITQFQLVCDRSWYVTIAQSVYMFGVMCGVFAAGVVSD